MNCKPGDMAQVVRDGSSKCMRALRMAVVQVVKPRYDLAEGVMWLLDQPHPCPLSKHCTFAELPDSILKPLPKLDDEQDTCQGNDIDEAHTTKTPELV